MSDRRRYLNLKGDVGEIPFTPDNPPAVTEERLDHIMVGKPKENGWSGEHEFGAGKGKLEFPEHWNRDVVRAAIMQILSDPNAEIERQGSTLYFRGTVDGQPLEVRVRGRQGEPKLWTAYPVEG